MKKSKVKASESDMVLTPTLVAGKRSLVERYFGIDWLMEDNIYPLQRLWKRSDDLASQEISILGDALENISKLNENWIKRRVKTIKGNDLGNAAGAMFEIVGLNFIEFDGSTATPSKENSPGYDGVINLSDNGTILISIKNHRMSQRERKLRACADNLHIRWKNLLEEMKEHDGGIVIYMPKLLLEENWETIWTDIRNLVARKGVGNWRAYAGQNLIICQKIEPTYGPLSRHGTSCLMKIFVPYHRNEQLGFISKIREAINNLEVGIAKENKRDCCGLILIKVPITASMNDCVRWTEQFLSEEHPEKIGYVVLYQYDITEEGDGDFISISHCFRIVESGFAKKWIHRGDRNIRFVKRISVFIGKITEPHYWEHDAGGKKHRIDDHYVYQKGQLIFMADPSAGFVDYYVGNFAPGIVASTVVERSGLPVSTLSSASDDLHSLELLS